MDVKNSSRRSASFLDKLALTIFARLVAILLLFGLEPVKFLQALRSFRFVWFRNRGINSQACRYRISRLHPGDGGGAQLQGILATYVFCRAKGFEYLHSPIKRVEHGAGESWVSSWEGLFTWDTNYSGAERVLRLDNFWDSLRIVFSFSLKDAFSSKAIRSYADSQPMAYQLRTTDIRSRFQRSHLLSEDSRAHLESSVVVHLRRGDVDEGELWWRFTPTSEVWKIVEFAKERFRKNAVTCFTNANMEEAKELESLGWNVDNYSSPFDVLTVISHAKVFVMAKSSFSYLAAILCEGQVIYEPFWHPPLPEWIVADLGD